jgi:ABC-type Fe3+-hydroxamate transport system substrate-binding protein
MRIISLCPSLTELVFDLGAGDELVGRTKFCVHPEPAVSAIEKVGGTKNPKIERIIALEPDLVLMNEEENRREDAEALAAARVNCLTSMPRDARETATMVRRIGEAIGRSDAGERIASAIEAARERVRAAALERQRVSFAYLIWREPLMTVSGDTFVSAILGEVGAINVFEQASERYPEITAGQLAAAAPDAVLLSSEPFPFKDKHADELAARTGLAREAFHLVDGELLSWHGSRTIRGLEYAGELMESLSRLRTGQP